MRVHSCNKCHIRFTEADKMWDLFHATNKCPNCELIEAGFSVATQNKDPQLFVGKSEVKRNRVILGLFLITLSALFFVNPMFLQTHEGYSLLSRLIAEFGARPLSLPLACLGIYFLYSGFKK